MSRTFVLAAGIAASLLPLRPLDAQASTDSSARSVAGIMRLLRSEGSSGWSLRTLRQSDGRVNPQQIEELADSLVSYVSGYPEEVSDPDRVLRVIGVIARAGQPGGEGTAYRGAADRLLEIAEKSDETAGAALFHLTQLPDKPRSLAGLSHIAASPGRGAPTAVRMLTEYMGEPGLESLRDLHRRNALRNAAARELVEAQAKARGWKRSTPER